MEDLAVLDIGKQTVMVYLKIALPILLVALTVGLTVSLFQALTQIQEATLSFVPKMIAVFLCIIFLMSYISGELHHFSSVLQEQIIHIP
jgi:flagellar biosynthetic protein FliQ